MIQNPLVNKLIQALSPPLPGWEAQKLMSPSAPEKYRIPSPNAKKAGVMLLLYPENEGLSLIYIKRTGHPADPHSGQISFPGGQAEKDDKDHQMTALRELKEEIGIKTADVSMIGALTPIYVFVSDFMVYPFLGYLPYKPQYILQPSEVQSVINIAINKLFADHTKAVRDIKIRNTRIKDVPYYNLNDEILWGATAMITSEFEQIVKKLLPQL